MAGDPFFTQVLTQSTAAATAFNTFTTAQSVINQTELVTIPPNFLKVGRKLRITVSGGLSNVVTAQPTFTFQVMMGTVVAWTSGAIATNTTAHTLLPFKLVVDLRCDSIGTGTTAKLVGMGWLNGIQFTVGAGADSTTVVGMFPVPATAPAVGTGFDSTISNILDFKIACQTSNAGNGGQIWDYCVELLQ